MYLHIQQRIKVNNNMAAQRFILTQTPVQILDCTKAAYVQEVVGTGVKFTVSVTAPNPTTIPACEIIKNDISISDGFPVWDWSKTAQNVEITVLTSEY
jgi:hypothetical protein